MIQTNEQPEQPDVALSEFEVPASAVFQDGVYIDIETGEVHAVAPQGSYPDQAFRVDRLAAAEWVLERMLNRESAIDALERRMATVVTNLTAMIADERRRLDGLHRRFDGELEAYARDALGSTGWKTKTLKTPYGAISFRTTQGTHRIADQLGAVAWAKRVAPEIVKSVEYVNVTDVLPRLDDGESPAWLETSPGGERCTIKAGVK